MNAGFTERLGVSLPEITLCNCRVSDKHVILVMTHGRHELSDEAVG